MTELLTATVNGVPVGCVYALLAVGLVVTYSTSGVFNLALGVQAYASALLYYVLVGWITAEVASGGLLGRFALARGGDAVFLYTLVALWAGRARPMSSRRP